MCMTLWALAWQDHAVIVIYLAAMLGLGFVLARRKRSDDEYFLAGRRMPWFAVGMSVIASLLSSLTYLSEPGEVWKSGITHVLGKMVAIPFEMLVVWLLLIPFLMRFRFTSAYEYLEHRFGLASRRWGATLFVLMIVLWMGFVVLASSQALAQVSGMHLVVVIGTVGAVATIYTMLGGLRAVIWTDVTQVTLLIGGGLVTIGYVVWTTGTWLPDWYQAATQRLQTMQEPDALPLFSWDPTVRATVFTVGLNMFIWHICTHTANQMTVQRYFSTPDLRSARASFVTGSLFSVGINGMLVIVGLAVLYFYDGQSIPVDAGLDPQTQQRDLIFPTFAVHRLPAGVGGAVLAALLAAGMSSIDSGINSIATVLSVEWSRDRKVLNETNKTNHVRMAMAITLVMGTFITMAAYGLSFLPSQWGIVGAMPRTFNAVTGPLGGLFLIGIFMPWVGQRAALIATALGLATSVVLGYLEQITAVLYDWQWLAAPWPAISFTWIMPVALLVCLSVAALLGTVTPARPRAQLGGLTWSTRRQPLPRNLQSIASQS